MLVFRHKLFSFFYFTIIISRSSAALYSDFKIGAILLYTLTETVGMAKATGGGALAMYDPPYLEYNKIETQKMKGRLKWNYIGGKRIIRSQTTLSVVFLTRILSS